MLFLIKSKETDKLIDVVDIEDRKIYEKKHPEVYLESFEEGLISPFDEED